MFGELFHYNIKVDDNAKKEAVGAFYQISEGKSSFDFQRFSKVAAESPQLLDWIDRPGHLMS